MERCKPAEQHGRLERQVLRRGAHVCRWRPSRVGGKAEMAAGGGTDRPEAPVRIADVADRHRERRKWQGKRSLNLADLKGKVPPKAGIDQ